MNSLLRPLLTPVLLGAVILAAPLHADTKSPGYFDLGTFAPPTDDGMNMATWKHDTEVYQAKVSPDSRWVAASDSQRILTVRDANTGQIAAHIEFQPPPRSPLDFEFSPNGQAMLVARYDEAPAELRETRSGGLLGILQDQGGERRTLQFSRDGRQAAIGNLWSPAQVYNTEICGDADDLLSLAQGRVARSLTPQERARFLGNATVH